MKGIDFTTPLTTAKAKEVKAAGYDFVCRYLVSERLKSKRITKEEANAITDAGMFILSVYETTADRAKGGAEAGRADGKAALYEAKLIEQPIGSAIYFAVDYDTHDYDTIEAYLRNAFAELSGYAIGVYGSYDIVEEMAKRKACTHFWQTYAWSRGLDSIHKNVYQYKNGVKVCGISCDLNNSYDNEGFWKYERISKVLKKGMICDEVITLQTLLNKYGYHLTADGNFGAATETAVKGFQTRKGLASDGIVGAKTWEKLYS